MKTERFQTERLEARASREQKRIIRVKLIFTMNAK